MFTQTNLYAQQSFDLYGNLRTSGRQTFRLNSLESNPGNLSDAKSWELSFIYGGIFASGSQLANDIFLVSLSKRISDHYLYFRFTPGIKQEFSANTQKTISSGDSTITEILSTFISYQEKIGLGYSLQITNKFSAGLSLRYFKQILRKDDLEFVYGENIFAEPKTIAISEKINFWRGDLGINYSPLETLSFNLNTINLFCLNENGNFNDNEGLELRKQKHLSAGVNFMPRYNMNIYLNYESNNSASAGLNYGINLRGGKIIAGVSAYRDVYQNPFISGISPSISYSSQLFNVSIVGVKYFSDRNIVEPISNLIKTGIHNILNNKYSKDKLLLNINIALSFTPEKLVEFKDVKILSEIYPTLDELYTTTAFATAKVINISDQTVNVKPASFIEGINTEQIFSPIINIAAGDTVDVPFYTIISDQLKPNKKRTISQANFYLITVNSDYDDQISKPILINDMNSWDGKVSNLRYFSKYDYSYSTKFAKNILKEYKAELDNIAEELAVFSKIKILFNTFVQHMIYVSDPRSSVEFVQFPQETIDRKGGDCDDLSVAFSSILESVGVQTAFVDYKSEDGISHVNLLINTGLSPDAASLITNNDKKYYVRKNSRDKDELWIPIEMTSLADLETAWNVGADKFYKEAVENLGLAKGNVQVIDNY
jgi:transglutaminase-like putative cysteine protease